MSKRKALAPREELTVIEDRLLEEAQGQFWREMDKVFAMLKAVLDKYRIPIVAKMDLDDWKKTKEAFSKLLFMVIDRADDDDDAEHHKTIKLAKEWNLTREFPAAFYELMRIAAVDDFMQQYDIHVKTFREKKELILPEIECDPNPITNPSANSYLSNRMNVRDEIKNNIVDERL